MSATVSQQVFDALLTAKTMRYRKALLRRRVAAAPNRDASRVELADVLAPPLDPAVRRTEMFVLLDWVRKSTEPWRSKILKETGISEYREIGQATHRQLGALQKALRK